MLICGIDTKDISIVVQGEIHEQFTPAVITSLRKSFPEAEIILSTWEGSNTDPFDVDKCCFSVDPGAVLADEKSQTKNNINRQLISTQAGLKLATRSYILKTRTDIVFHNADFLFWFKKYDVIPSLYFENRLLICNYCTRNPRVFPACLHPSDWIVFGNQADVKKYYQHLPLMTDEEGTWFRSHSKGTAFLKNYICRFTPEQHIFIYFLRGLSDFECTCYYDCNPDLVALTEKSFAECFVVLDYQRQLPISFLKYNPNRYRDRYTLISFWRWQALYRHYCKKIFSFYWYAHLLSALFLSFVSKVRAVAIKILDCLGLKETVKSLLTYF